jgi:2-polyprenyl-3-methyl-5-hydroxy-6-metoxy-1,4-benzoquinol methylase
MAPLRNCPLCGSDHSVGLHEEPRRDGTPGVWTLRACRACGFVFLGDAVPAARIADQYEWRHSFAAEAARRRRRQPVATRLGRFLNGCLRRVRPAGGPPILRLVLRYKQQGRLCDFGCGEGRLLRAASERFSVTGIDISAPQVALARAAVGEAPLIVGPVTDQRLPAGSFDVVTMECYLEHEQEPLVALRAAWTALRPGGLLAIKVPNYASWLRRLRGWKWCGFRYPDHCNYFTPPTLRAMVRRAGFQVAGGSILDRLPTSDNMYLAAVKPAAANPTPASPDAGRSPFTGPNRRAA